MATVETLIEYLKTLPKDTIVKVPERNCDYMGPDMTELVIEEHTYIIEEIDKTILELGDA